MKWFRYFFFISLLTGCTKDRVSELTEKLPPPQIPTDSTHINFHSLFINEFLAKESAPNDPDWVEIYNPYSSTITMLSGRWFLTDSLGQPNKFQLPAIVLPAKGFGVIYCDSGDSLDGSGAAHANFGLSSKGEAIGLYYKDSTGSLVPVDSFTFGAQNADVSFGRIPDGGSTFQSFSSPTKGQPNH
ncbi:MAG: lamin tail domain-containing protein [Chitinophagales bacterium]